MPKWMTGLRAVVDEVITQPVIFGWVVTTFVVALAGPFGTFETRPLIWRLVYWGGLIGVAIVIAIGFRVFWRSVIKEDPAWLEDFAVISSLAVVFGPFIVGLNRWIMGPDAETAINVFHAIGVTFGIGLATVALRRSVHQSIRDEISPRQDRLLARLNLPNGTRIARVSSDNHHVRVVTFEGEEVRLLMRLRDAVAEIDVEPGACIHRSHWVAFAQLDQVFTVGSKENARLRCGAVVPIGAKYRPNLIAAGLITV